jgi:hypothetical protein
MNRRLVSIILTAAVVAAPTLRAQQIVRPPRSADALADHYRRAHARKDVHAIARLF